jgi:hypothetical protein
VLCAALAAAVAVPSAATFFRATFTGSTFPAYGFSTVVPGAGSEWTRSNVAGGGAHGGDALLIRQIPGSNGEFGMGMDVDATPPAQGATRYIRWRHKWSADTNFRGSAPEGATPYMNGKLIMMPHFGGPPGIRASVLWESKHSPFDGTVKFYIGNANGGYQTGYVARVGQWVYGQLRVRSSSHCGVSDGSMTVWINNNDSANPTPLRSSESSPWQPSYGGLNICTEGWSNIRFGAYMNKGLQATGIHNMFYDAFEVGDEFDPTWNRGGGSASVPTAPRNLRVVGN